jgi:hypothetical protein
MGGGSTDSACTSCKRISSVSRYHPFPDMVFFGPGLADWIDRRSGLDADAILCILYGRQLYTAPNTTPR